ncbi:unnamed protein product [Lathyrus sativus]|nr:unnamed protein product [Lathyrus sativus]
MDHDERKPMGHYKVNLINGWYDCGKFQTYRVPCSHVIVAWSNACHKTYALFSNVYKVANLFGVYNTSFSVLSYSEYWPVYEGDQIFHNPRMRRNKKGCPMSTRIRTKMDIVNKMERKYFMCLLPNHTQTQCPNVRTSNS